MAVEADAFIPAVQETAAVFAERISVCTNCFLVFEDGPLHRIAGYFSAERWETVPETDSAFRLGHSAARTHSAAGSVLYLSSFALLKTYRGSGLGTELFSRSLAFFISHNSGIQTLLLLVSSTWKNAVRIYGNNGFLRIRTIPAFFPAGVNTPPSDGIIMIRGAQP
jgi:ribosomal-protein-alanine N-acetyltransferase